MTLQEATNAIYAICSDPAVRTVEFPVGNTVVYRCVLANTPDDGIQEPYFSVFVNVARERRFFREISNRVTINLEIYDVSEQPTGTQTAMLLASNVVNTILGTVPMLEYGEAVLTPVGYTEDLERFQHNLEFTFSF